MTLPKKPAHPAGAMFIRIPVGLIFLTQGMLKYIDPNLGVNRFMRIGFPHPAFTAHFEGAFEMICGILVLVRIFTQGRRDSTSRDYPYRHPDHQDPGIDANRARILVYGKRRSNRFRHAHVPPVPAPLPWFRPRLWR